MNRGLLTIAAALCLCLAACGSGKVYPKPLAEMHEALAGVDDLPPVFGSADPGLSMETSDPSAVIWVLSIDGSEMMRFVAKLEPEDEKSTRMTLDLVGAASGPRGNIQKRLEEHPELKRLYLVAMTEQIESTIDGRSFDASKTYGALAAATAANIGNISSQLDKVAEADRKRSADNMKKAYAQEEGQ